jgi:hypothetical protein
MFIGYGSGVTNTLYFYSNNLESMRCLSASVYIGNLNTYDHNNTRLIVYGSGTYIAIFKHPNDTQGIGIQYDGIAVINTNQSVFVRPNGSGRFEVSSSTNNIGIITNLLYFGNNSVTALVKANTNFGDCCEKFNGSIWVTSWIGTSSDSRIKEDIQDINDDDTLNKLLVIEPKTYKYIDKIAKGENKVYGFIAQQIREVIPEATSLQKSYIPNIMLLSDYNDQIMTLPSPTNNIIIKQNDKIKCYDKDNKEVCVEVEEVKDNCRFRIKPLETEYIDNKIFVYGTEIDDFYTLSKEYIFTLNVCATQELHRKIKMQEDLIKELEGKMEQILNYISL